MAEHGNAQGWQPDPFGLHQRRYFSDGRPTKLVRDGDQESYDEPPADDSAAPGAVEEASVDEIALARTAETSALTGGEPEDRGTAGAHDETSAPAAVAVVTADTAATDGGEDEAASPASGNGALAEAPRAGPRAPEDEPDHVSAADAAATVTGADPSSVAPDTLVNLATLGILRKPPRGLVYAGAAVAAVVIVLAVIAITGGFSAHAKPGTFGALAQSGSNQGSGAGSAALDTAAAAVVTASAQKTLAQRTADVTLSGTATGAGAALPLRGNGQVDFSDYATMASLGTTSNGGAVAESEIATSSNIYLQLALGGHVMVVQSTGRHWMNIPIAQETDQSGDMTAYSLPWSLQLLSQQPASVVSLGTRTIGGVQCNGYQVTPSTQALVTVVQQEWVRLGLPAKDRGAATQALQKAVAAPITAWFDPHRQLACEMTVDMQLTNATTSAWTRQPTAAVVQMTADFTHFGVPVRITAPAGSDSVLF